MFFSAAVIFEVVFVLAAARSRLESWGEICGGAGLGGAGSAVSGAGRGRGAGRLAGGGGGAGGRSSGGGSVVFVVSGGGISAGWGVGGASSGGGAVLTEGGAARTIRLLPQPAEARAVANNRISSSRCRIYLFPTTVAPGSRGRVNAGSI